ncbi:hypothetical protein V1521DRAFT_431762 [Lipomyces starkeyi]
MSDSMPSHCCFVYGHHFSPRFLVCAIPLGFPAHVLGAFQHVLLQEKVHYKYIWQLVSQLLDMTVRDRYSVCVMLCIVWCVYDSRLDKGRILN